MTMLNLHRLGIVIYFIYTHVLFICYVQLYDCIFIIIVICFVFSRHMYSNTILRLFYTLHITIMITISKIDSTFN